MKNIAFSKLLTIFLIFGALTPRTSDAGPYTDDLSRCFVSSTTRADKVMIESWVFSTMALNPDITELASVSDKQREHFSSETAKIFERLLTDTCLEQAKVAIKNEGVGALDASFATLGQAALVEISSNRKVAEAMAEFASRLDKRKISSALNLALPK